MFFIFFFIASFCTVLIGNFFLNLVFYKNNNYQFSLSENGLFGLILLSFISLFLNFFFKINELISSILFIIPIIHLIIINKKINWLFFKKLILHSFVISLVAIIFVAFDNVNRPDAGIYHLPFTRIINDFKIFIGVSNLNPLFGVTSIFQYTAAIYNNFIFKDLGITIPIALLAIYFIEYCLREFFSNKNSKDFLYKIYIFSITSYFFIEMNRYSDYGNDNPGHIYFFYLISLFLKKEFILKNKNNFKLFTLISLFCFLIRPFLIVSLFFPIYFWFKNKFFFTIRSLPIFSIIFFLLWCIKNILISGCAIYPVSFTCFDSLAWYSSDSKFRIAARNTREFSELHAKGWRYIVDNINYQNYSIKTEEKNKYLKNFNWLNSEYITRHSFTITKKIDFFIIYLFTVSLFIYLFKDKKKKINFLIYKNFRYNFLFLISILGLCLFIYKFPLGRYGTSYLSIFIVCLFYPILNFLMNQCRTKKIQKLLTVFLIILSTIFFLKNFKRIAINYSANYNNAPWPRIYDNSFKILDSKKNQNIPIEFNKINKNNLIEIYYIDTGNIYLSQRKILCLFNKAPCTQSSENFNNFDLELKKGYYFIKLKK